MFIGLILGSIALRCTVKEATTVAVAPLIAIWAVLIMDSTAALMRRKLTGRSIFHCDRNHIHHRLLSKGYTPQQISLFVAAVCTVTSVGAILAVWCNSPLVAVTVASGTLALLVLARVFGHVELSMIATRAMQTGRNSVYPFHRVDTTSSVKIHGDAAWDDLWQAVIEQTPKMGVSRVRLNLHSARDQEDYFGSWESRERPADGAHAWKLERPFVHEGVIIGTISAEGACHDTGNAARFLEFSDDLMDQVSQVLATRERRHEGRPIRYPAVNAPSREVPQAVG